MIQIDLRWYHLTRWNEHDHALLLPASAFDDSRRRLHDVLVVSALLCVHAFTHAMFPAVAAAILATTDRIAPLVIALPKVALVVCAPLTNALSLRPSPC